MQISGLQRNVYRLASYALRHPDTSPEAKKRLKALKLWQDLRKEGAKSATIQKATGISRSTFFKLQAAYRKEGMKALEPRSRAPRKRRKSLVPDRVKQVVYQLRLENPTWGKIKIHQILCRDHGIFYSQSTIGRLLSALIKEGKVKKYFPAAYRRRRRQFKGHAKPWKGDIKANKMGELIQIDHMSVTKNGLSFKEFHAIDPISKMIVTMATSNATSAAEARFLRRVQDKFPFPIRSIQVDGGTEFMKTFEAQCQDKNIPLFVLPPKQPQKNGNVERSNRTFREELYARSDINANSVQAFDHILQQYTHKYNSYRPHQGIENMTPWEYTKSILGEITQESNSI